LRSRHKLLNTILLSLLVVMSCYPASAASATSEVGGSTTAITIKSVLTVTDDPDDDDRILLAGLATTPGGEPTVLAMEWKVKDTGWFPFWGVFVHSELNLVPSALFAAGEHESELGRVTPVKGHTYEATLSYDPTSRYLALSLFDQTDARSVAKGHWRLDSCTDALYGVADATATMASYPWYEPIAVWDVGSGPKEKFFALRFLEPSASSLVRFKALGPLPGEYRVLSATDEQLAVLPGSQVVEGENWISVPSNHMPLGATTVTFQYVDQEQVRFSETQEIVLGKVDAALEMPRVDQTRGQVTGHLMVKSQSDLRDINLKLEASISALRWNAATAVYDAQLHSTVEVDLGRVVAVDPQGVTLPFGFAVPDVPGIWRADLKLTADPDVVTEFRGDAIAFSTQSWALLGNETLSVTTDHADALYSVGEPITFRIRVTQKDQPIDGVGVQWTLKRDGGYTLDSGVTVIENGEAVVTGTLGEPGFLQLQATYTFGGQSLSVTAGAGVDPLAIKPSLPVPDDFDVLWAEKKALLAQVPLKAQEKRVNSGSNSLDAYDVQVDALGAPVSGYVVLPKGAKPGSLPAILTLHGAGVVSASLSRATGWAQEGMLAMDINAHGLPNGMASSYYKELASGELADYRVRGIDSRDDFYFLGMFLRVIRAIDYLTSRPEWDGRTVILYGTSQGGAQSYAGAGLDSRVTFFVAGVSAMADLTGRAENRATGWPGLGLTNHPNPVIRDNRINTARYFDAVNMATRTKADGFFTVGFIDTTCPPTAVYAAYNNVGTNKLIYNDIAAGHTNTPEATRLMREAVLNHVKITRDGE
jgi:cephalosporin-C deacetylase